MKIKTAELNGRALNWAVAICDNFPAENALHLSGDYSWAPGTKWMHGGPIIEREIARGMRMQKGMAFYYNDGIDNFEFLMRGPTPLIAAMRCYVASKLGDEIDVPDTLTN
jgi:hypothetical protein